MKTVLFVSGLFVLSVLCLFLYIRRGSERAKSMALLLYIAAMSAAIVGAVLALMNMG